MHRFYLKFRLATILLVPACFLIALSVFGSFSVAEASESTSHLMNIIEASDITISMDQAVTEIANESQSTNQSWGGFFWAWEWIWNWFSGPSLSAPEPDVYELHPYGFAWSG